MGISKVTNNDHDIRTLPEKLTMSIATFMFIINLMFDIIILLHSDILVPDNSFAKNL